MAPTLRLLATRIATSALVVLLFVGNAAAQEIEIGMRQFHNRCAICHGPQGGGDGPLADLLKERPGDLRALARENGGTFPFIEVYQAIDGRRQIRAHGGATMPIWGDYFKTEALVGTLPRELSAEEIVMGRILSIVYYLQAIQQL